MGIVSSSDDLSARLTIAEFDRDFFKSILDSFNAMTVLVVDTEPLAQVRFSNTFACYHSGISYEKAVTMNAYDFAATPDDDIGKINQAIEQTMKGEGPVYIHGYFRSRQRRKENRDVTGFMIVQKLERPGETPCLMFTTLDKSRLGLYGAPTDDPFRDAELADFAAKNPPSPRPPIESYSPEALARRIAEMEKERDFFKLILDALNKISVMVVDTEPMGQVRYANHYFCLHNNVAYEKAITMNAYEFASTPDDDVKKINGAMARVMKGEGPATINGYFRSRGDKPELHSVWAVMIIQKLDLPGMAPRIMLTTIGLSELGLTMDGSNVSLARVQAITTATNDAVVLLDENGSVTFWNVAAEKMFGVMANQAIGRGVAELIIPERERERFGGCWAKCLDLDKPSFEGNVFETSALRKDGGELPVEVSAGPLRLESGKWGAVGFFRDIRARKKLEEDLLAAKEQAENANKLKDQFVALVSHDLRSPLASIVGMLEVLRGKVKSDIKPEAMFYLNRSVDNCNRLMSMIDRLLDVSRLKSGKVRLRKRFIDLKHALSDWLELLMASANEKGIAIRTDIPQDLRIFADELLFSQVIQNVVGNALKFCKKGDVISISADAGKPGILAVKDTGPGVEEVFIQNLFDPAVRTTSRGTAGERGLGLGLPLCHDVMKAHGGKIWVESNRGKGAAFYLELPQVKALALLVEDQDVIRQEMAELLTAMGAEVMEASNGKEAIALLADAQPHLVITDVMMPQMDGWDLLRYIRKDYSLEALPVIVITSSGQREAKEVAFQLGANDFVLKPVIPDDFMPRVKRFLR